MCIGRDAIITDTNSKAGACHCSRYEIHLRRCTRGYYIIVVTEISLAVSRLSIDDLECA